jgi:adenine-specific DNA-methyltransferase
MSNSYVTILDKLSKAVESNAKYKVEDALNKNLLAEDARKYNVELLNLLQNDSSLKSHFFTETEGGLVFKKDVFLQFISNKEFLPDSYTRYANKIGLGSDDGSLLSGSKDVVLNWPYKDAVLEGGQDKEDQKRSEVFFNEILAPDQITRLLDNKVFTNWKRYDKDGEHELDKLKDDDNLIVKGNNLVVLHSLRKRYAGKIKLIYIDPPYNTGNDGFGYNDRFNHSSWLTFMKNRLEVSRDLLSNDGSIWITLDDNEFAYLRVLMDEVFGRDNFKATFVWHHRKSSQNDIDVSLSHNYTVCFSKNKNSFKLYQLPVSSDGWENPDNDPRGPWVADPFDAPNVRPNLTYPITNPNTGDQHLPPSGRHWRFSREKFASALKDDRIVWGKTGKSKPQLKRFLSEAQEKGRTPFTIWSDVETATNATKELMKMHGRKDVFSTPKPESLIERILLLGTKEGDIVLDYHLGSGTTAAVAHKMGRQYIGVEQMHYGDNDPTVRLKNVIDGDQTGISKSVDWQGGGSFVYANIMNNANTFRERVEKAKDDKEYLALLEEATSSSFLSYRVDPTKLNETEFRKLSSADKRRLLLELIDNNTLYVNYEDINDPSFKISDSDKKFNEELYK